MVGGGGGGDDDVTGAPSTTGYCASEIELSYVAYFRVHSRAVVS